MAKCPTCQRELPLSGKCPVCQKGVGNSVGFSLKDLFAKSAKTGQSSQTLASTSASSLTSGSMPSPANTSTAGSYSNDDRVINQLNIDSTNQDKSVRLHTETSNLEKYSNNDKIKSLQTNITSAKSDTNPNSTISSAVTELFEIVEKTDNIDNSDIDSCGNLVKKCTNKFQENHLDEFLQTDFIQNSKSNIPSGSNEVPIFKTLKSNEKTQDFNENINKGNLFTDLNSNHKRNAVHTLGKMPDKATNQLQPDYDETTSTLPVINQQNEFQKSDVNSKINQDIEGDYDKFRADVTGYGDEEMEVAVLAGILNDSFILNSSLSKGLIIDLFSSRSTKAICKAILALREESKETSLIDKIILKNKLKQIGMYDTNMQQLLEKVASYPCPTLDQVLNYLEIMKESALKRKLKEISLTIANYIDNPQASTNISIESFTNKIIQELREVQKAKTTKRISLIREEMKEIMKDIELREEIGEIDIIGFSCEPFHYLNIALSGFRKGFMYAIAGAPRRGKTTFTLELATAVATNCKIPVLFFTYEQTKRNLTYRLIAKESRLNPDTLQRKKIKSDTIMDAKFMGGWKKMQAYMDYFYIIEATKADTVDRIRSYAYNVMQDFNTEDIMIFVDYIQKMPLNRDYRDEKFKVEEISTELKALSIELNNPIMTISSLSKEGCMIDATPNDDRPTLYHCKGSGDLEYDLDCAMIQAKDWGDTKELYTQLQHKAEELGKDPTRVPKVDVVNLYLDKNRDAPEGIYSVLQYLFFIEDNKFIELGPKYEDDRYRFSKIENVLEQLIQNNYIIFYNRDKNAAYNKGRVQIKIKNI